LAKATSRTAGDRVARAPAGTNQAVADALERVAELLEVQHADPYRVRAYRNGARTIRALDRDVATLAHEGGHEALEQLPHIGPSLAALVEELLSTGRIGLLERLEGQVAPEDLFATVPGIGEHLAHELTDKLHIETLEELELAAHNGRLAHVPGFGKRRVKAVREALASMLSRSTRRRARLVRQHLLLSTPEDNLDPQALEVSEEQPVIAELLRVDRLYRTRARQGRLRRIAPRRFNPRAEAWLPVMHLHEDGWHFTAMYSNTARAHRLRKIDDWVVIYFERDGHESQCTVVTEYRGPDGGRRVIRGRERECQRYYERQPRERHFIVPDFSA
jgi:hypothetical protein